MIGPFRDAIVQSLRHAVVPLVAYYTVTLVIPLTNGAARAGSGFGEHALVVGVVPCVVIVLGGALRTIAGYVGDVLRRRSASVAGRPVVFQRWLIRCVNPWPWSARDR